MPRDSCKTRAIRTALFPVMPVLLLFSFQSSAESANAPIAQGFTFAAAYSSVTAQVKANWDHNGNPSDTSYQLEASSGPLPNGFYGNVSLLIEGSYGILSGLLANTTYYVRVSSPGGTYSDFSSTSTLAQKPSAVSAVLYTTSATFSIEALPASPPEETAEGYLLHVSSSADFKGVVHWSSTTLISNPTFTVIGLLPNTTYYYRIGPLNWLEMPNFSDIGFSATFTDPPQGFRLLDIRQSSATFDWNAYPALPSSASAAGYRLEASSSDFSGTGTVLSSETRSVSLSTLTVTGLDANTTWYFRMGALNLSWNPSHTSAVSSVTLAQPVFQPVQTTPYDRSIRADWINPGSWPQSVTSEGYRLEASSLPFGSGGTVYSSSTADGSLAALTVQGLRPNTEYLLRLASLNWDGTPNYIELPSVTTLFAPALESLVVAGIWQSSMSASWTPVSCDGYVLEASTVNTFSAEVFRSSTSNEDASSLTVPGLSTNTVYYLRAGPVFNGTTIYAFTSPTDRSTLAPPLADLQIAEVFETSATLNWRALPASPQEETAEGYRLATSTSPVFAGAIISSDTGGVGLSTLTLTALIPNTSYYFRAGGLNWNDTPGYSVQLVTVTAA
ncbi:MAG: hypothetical protein ABIG11_03610, partial [bacterium]